MQPLHQAGVKSRFLRPEPNQAVAYGHPRSGLLLFEWNAFRSHALCHMQQSSLIHRFSRGGMHLLFSVLVAVVVALWVFGVWYPAPFRDLSGGLHLFGILIAVDLVLGPLATTVVSKPGKSLREWRMDVALIVLLQFAALGYGVWTMYQARPVYLAFEIDRLRVVNAVDVAQERLPMAPANFQNLI